MRLAKAFALGAAAAALAVTAAVAQESPHDQREKLMKGMGGQLGPLVAMVQGKSDYDAEKAKAAADKLAELANSDWEPLFPEGSVTGRATPAIWEKWDEFMADKQALADATTKLAASAGDGVDALKAGFGPVGGACGTCHKSFRAPE